MSNSSDAATNSTIERGRKEIRTADAMLCDLRLQQQQLEERQVSLREQHETLSFRIAALAEQIRRIEIENADDRQPSQMSATEGDSGTPRDTAMARNWRWAFWARDNGLLEDYAGKHIVVSGEQVVAADWDSSAAIDAALVATGAEEKDFAVLYIDEPGKAGWL